MHHFPARTFVDSSNLRATNAKLSANSRVCLSGVSKKNFNFFNLFNREYGVKGVLASLRSFPFPKLPRMEKVFSSRHPFEVYRPIIRLVVVNVVRVRKIFRVWNKRHSDKPVKQDIPWFLPVLASKRNGPVSGFIFSWFQEKGCFSRCSSGVVERFNPSKRTYIINSLVPRHILPDFFFHFSTVTSDRLQSTV